MIRARLSNGDFLLGLDAENVRRLQAGQPIRVDLSQMGGHDQVFVMFGQTLQDVLDEMMSVFGPLDIRPPETPQ